MPGPGRGSRVARPDPRIGIPGGRRPRPAGRRADGATRAAHVRAARVRRRGSGPRRAGHGDVRAAGAAAGRRARRRAGREAGRAGAAGRHRAPRSPQAQPPAGAALEGPGHRPGPDPPGHRAVHVPLLAPHHVADPGRLRRGVLVRPVPQGRGVGHVAGVQRPRAAAPGVRAGRGLGRLPRARARLGLPLRRRHARRDGHGHVPGVAVVLYRRHRLVSPAAARPAARGPRRPVLQRRRGRRHHAGLAGLADGRAAAARRPPGPADGQAALADHPRRRLPHPLRRHRRPGSVLAHGPDAAPAAARPQG